MMTKITFTESPAKKISSFFYNPWINNTKVENCSETSVDICHDYFTQITRRRLVFLNFRVVRNLSSKMFGFLSEYKPIRIEKNSVMSYNIVYLVSIQKYVYRLPPSLAAKTVQLVIFQIHFADKILKIEVKRWLNVFDLFDHHQSKICMTPGCFYSLGFCLLRNSCHGEER